MRRKRERRSFMRNGCGGKVQGDHLSANFSDRRQRCTLLLLVVLVFLKRSAYRGINLSLIAVHLADEGLHGHVFCQDFSRLLA